MPPVTAQDIILQINDHLVNYTDGSIDENSRFRAVNRAVEYIQRRMTLPSDKRTTSILFSQDNNFYNMPVDFNEPLLVTYGNPKYNNGRNKWGFRPDVELVPILGQWTNQRYFGQTSLNQLKQLILKGTNIIQGSTLITFDQLGSIVGQNDADDLAIDNNVYVEGNGSLSFSIDPVKGFGKGSIYVPVNWNVFQSHNALGYFKCQVYLPSIALSSINLVIGSSPTDYYVFSTTTTDAGTPLVANAWNLISWTFNNNPTIVGSPNDNAINFARFDFNESGSFGGTEVTGFRIDNFYSMFPDPLNLMYLSSYKATDTTGATLKTMVTVGTDIMLFGNYAPDLIGAIALRAAYILMPQTAGDKDFMEMYKKDCEEVIAVWAKTYPRQRVTNFGKTLLQRP